MAGGMLIGLDRSAPSYPELPNREWLYHLFGGFTGREFDSPLLHQMHITKCYSPLSRTLYLVVRDEGGRLMVETLGGNAALTPPLTWQCVSIPKEEPC